MQMPIPDDWDGLTFCRWAVCWPESPKWQAILDGLLSQPYRGRFWDADTGSITDVKASFRSTYYNNFILREVIMACGDTGLSSVAVALNNIAAALSANPQTGSNSGCGCLGESLSVQTSITLSDGSNWPIVGSGPLAELPPSGYPPNFESESAYLDDKCEVAHLIINHLIDTLRNMGDTNWLVGVIGAGLILACLVGLITVPEVSIPVLLFALAGNVGITTALLALATEIENDKEAWICVLYTGDNIETLTGTLADLLDAAIVAISVSGVIGQALKFIALTLVNGDVLGKLFSGAAHQAYAGADCSACEDCQEEVTFATNDGGYTGAVDSLNNAGSGSAVWSNSDDAWVFTINAISGIGNQTFYHMAKSLTPDDFGRKIVVRGTRVSTDVPAQSTGLFVRFHYGSNPDEVLFTGSLDGTEDQLNTFVSSYGDVTGYEIILGNSDLGSAVNSVNHVSGVTECRVTV